MFDGSSQRIFTQAHKLGGKIMLEGILLAVLLITNTIWFIVYLLRNHEAACVLVVNDIEDDFYLSMTQEEYDILKTKPDGSWISLKLQRIK